MAVLRDTLASARLGRGRLIVVSGEAGLGKTALVEAFARAAARDGAVVVHGRAWELADAPPYFPVWPCLRALAVEPGTRTPFELWEDVLGALATATSTQVVVWIIEDAHVADLQTLDLLAFLARPVGALGAVIVVTARAGDPRRDERVELRLGRMIRDGAELALAPLARADVAALAQDCTGGALAPALIDRLVALTGGNPLFITHCARTIDRTTSGNLCIAVPATPGYEKVPTVILQGHLDMVCEKNKDVDFDFTKDAIRLVRDGDWLRADGTTLGADNGIGVAAALAVAFTNEAVHGPLEILLTVNEETGLTGALNLSPSLLKGRILLNLDSERTGGVCIGCAGGGGVTTSLPVKLMEPPADSVGLEVKLTGYRVVIRELTFMKTVVTP